MHQYNAGEWTVMRDFSNGVVKKPNLKVKVLCFVLDAIISSPENLHGLELEVVTLI